MLKISSDESLNYLVNILGNYFNKILEEEDV